MLNKDDFDIEEIEYTDEEKNQVIDQLRIGLMFNEIQLVTTKRKLKSWFAEIQMIEKVYKKCEYCPDITGVDLIEISKGEGFKIIG